MIVEEAPMWRIPLGAREMGVWSSALGDVLVGTRRGGLPGVSVEPPMSTAEGWAAVYVSPLRVNVGVAAMLMVDEGPMLRIPEEPSETVCSVGLDEVPLLGRV